MNDEHQNSHEQRQEYRLTTPLNVFIELIAANDNSPATIVISHSLDISANGLRVIADRDLPVGSILSSCVQLDNTHQRFILSTEVKWSQAYKNTGEYLIGLALFESDNTDIMHWKEFVAEQFLKT
jgi:hypothetical protein